MTDLAVRPQRFAPARKWAGLCALVLTLLSTPTAAANDAHLVDALRAGGLVVLIRHAATESGTGDPPGFQRDDCTTQRNLSAAGRDQARALGAWFGAQRIPVGEVRSSRWCRCLDTATLAFAPQTTVIPWPPLDSFFDARHRADAATAAALAGLADPVAGNRVWVTHQVNITALSGIYPAPGELVVMQPRARPGGGYRMDLMGRLTPGTLP
ncbi:histidine phosphatase family protein [Denitromonas ohlonensis]|uniref:Histidine phosphatase family protein n=2 Tax=Denitromonas TaxID=139331 RepID=A0A557RS03_9RHOO|nr:histidine phosphatase family protein [Denitromonas ohlonensis]TVO67904.1 histidine phosphatase family protein [Denitromonas ohlonensis]TVO78191.1 histidine phosphatase family protein [Denitromonas ohlonensis]